MNDYNRDPTAKSYIAKTFKGKLDMWILVDGVYTGTFVVTADRADGERQDLALVGGWEIGIAHEVEVRFDGTGSGRGTYIDGVSLSEGHRRHQFNDCDVGHRTLPGRWRRPATQSSPERLSSRGRLR